MLLAAAQVQYKQFLTRVNVVEAQNGSHTLKNDTPQV